MKTKRCPKCEQELLMNRFSRNRTSKDGVASQCKECQSSDAKKYHYLNRNKIRRRKKEYYRENQVSISGRKKRYYEEHRDELLRQEREYRATIAGYLRTTFSNMDYRCSNPAGRNFKYYGGRGIENRFGSLDEFRSYVVDELQVDPRGLQCDRIDNEGHYERGNIRFVTAKVNMNNRRRSKKMVVV